MGLEEIEQTLDDYKHIIGLAGFILAVIIFSETLSKQLPLAGDLFGFKATRVYMIIFIIMAFIFWRYYFPKAEPKKRTSYVHNQTIPSQPIQREPIKEPVQQPIQRIEARPIFPNTEENNRKF